MPEYLLLPLAALAFPDIDPIAVRLGPLAIHWYGIAYVIGILFGWWYARRLVGDEHLWAGGERPMRPEDIDDFLVWAAVGIVLGGRIGYVLFYDFARYLAESARYFRGLGGRHVVPWRLRRHDARHDPVCPFARDPCLDAVRRDRGRRAGGARPGALHQLHQLGTLGEADRCFLGGRVPEWRPVTRHPSQLYEALLEGVVLFVLLRILTHSFGKLQRPRLRLRRLRGRLRAARAFFVEFFREPDPQLGYLFGGWLTMGMVLSLPMVLIGIWAMATARPADPPRTA